MQAPCGIIPTDCLVDGRWYSGGRRVVYTSDSLALATLECLVPMPTRLPAGYVGFRIHLPDSEIEELSLDLVIEPAKGNPASDFHGTAAGPLGR